MSAAWRSQDPKGRCGAIEGDRRATVRESGPRKEIAR